MKACAICGRPCPQRHAYKVRTCGRRCGGKLKSENYAALRLRALTLKGIHLKTPLDGYRLGYRAGYVRGKYAERKRTADAL